MFSIEKHPEIGLYGGMGIQNSAFPLSFFHQSPDTVTGRLMGDNRKALAYAQKNRGYYPQRAVASLKNYYGNNLVPIVDHYPLSDAVNML